jgi:acyl carrier protein
MTRIYAFWGSIYRALAYAFFILAHRFIIPLRYKIEVKGAEYLNPKKGGCSASTLFLASHSSHIDGTIMGAELLKRRLPITIWALDLTFKLPYLRWAARHVQVVKVPNIYEKRSEKHSSKLHKLVTRTADSLRTGHNFLIFPAGLVKKTPIEKIDGKSAVPLIIQQFPEVNIILVRISGLWGSRFSCATKPELRWATRSISGSQMFWQVLKMILLNAIFFIPKRKVTIEFRPAPGDFPRFGSRLEIGRYLERYYNEIWGLHGEPLNRVPDYFWKEQIIEHGYQTKIYKFNLRQVPKPIRNAIVKLVADKADLDCKEVDFDMHLGHDLGFDSLDLVEILIDLERLYGIKRMVPDDVTTVGHLIAIASKIPIVCEYESGRFHETVEKPLSGQIVSNSLDTSS